MTPPDYASARRAYLKITRERDKLRAGLKKAKVYDELSALAKELGFDVQSCENVDEVAAGILKQWTGPLELTHQFVILVRSSGNSSPSSVRPVRKCVTNDGFHVAIGENSTSFLIRPNFELEEAVSRPAQMIIIG